MLLRHRRQNLNSCIRSTPVSGQKLRPSEFLTEGEACKATLWPAQGLNQRQSIWLLLVFSRGDFNFCACNGPPRGWWEKYLEYRRCGALKWGTQKAGCEGCSAISCCRDWWQFKVMWWSDGNSKQKNALMPLLSPFSLSPWIPPWASSFSLSLLQPSFPPPSSCPSSCISLPLSLSIPPPPWIHPSLLSHHTLLPSHPLTQSHLMYLRSLLNTSVSRQNLMERQLAGQKANLQGGKAKLPTHTWIM